MERPHRRTRTAATVLGIATHRRGGIGHNGRAGPSLYDPHLLKWAAQALARDIRHCCAHTPDPQASLLLALDLEAWAAGLTA